MKRKLECLGLIVGYDKYELAQLIIIHRTKQKAVVNEKDAEKFLG